MLAAWPQLSAFLQTEGGYQLNTSLDAHVFAQIAAASPPNSVVGTSLVEKVRKAVTAHRALGADPTILVVSPGDAESLDLVQTADGAFLFGTSGTINASPMGKLKVVESNDTGIATHLIDPTRLGVLYVGQIEYAADPYTGFKKNLTTLRIEVNTLFHVRDANGAYVVEA